MSIRSKYALGTAAVWSIVLIVFLILFFEGNGPESWAVDSIRKLFGGILFFFGFVSFFVIQYKASKEPIDERITLVQLKATNSTLIFVLAFVYISLISLYLYYENSSIPTSWMWLLAYSTIFITYIVNSLLFFYFEGKETGYGIK